MTNVAKTPSLKGKTIVVSGGAGFVGSHLVRRLVEEGAVVHVLLRPETTRVRLDDVSAKLIVHEVDLCNAKKVSSELARISPSGIFHCAGVSQYFGHIPATRDLIETNIKATIELMDVAKDLSLDFFVNTGTSLEVGSKARAIREDDLLEPKELYSISRIPAELYAQALGREKGKPFVTIRVFTSYGPYMQKGRVLYETITRALRGADILLTKPSITRDFIYIDDLVDLYLRAAFAARKYPGSVFNGGSGVAVSLLEMARVVLRCTGSRSKVVWGSEAVPYDHARWEADLSFVEKALNWKPHRSFAEGVLKTVAWFREHEDYWEENSGVKPQA